jgi:phenylacetate-coenzyme A ligase PaaK-like adenylate-forming protein
MDELEPGTVYEIVITNFDGGVFVRYRIGDMVRVVALRNERLGIEIPQMVFETRCDDVIDLANFTRLTEKTIWQALENAGIRYADWTARKELVDQQYWLHLYVELKDGYRVDDQELAAAVHGQLRELDSDYRDLEEMLGLRIIQATVLPSGAFDRFVAEQQATGADPAHLKPPHMRASDEVIARLLSPGA